MELADVFEKLANNARLTPGEKQFLTLSMRMTQLRNAQVSSYISEKNTLKLDTVINNILDTKYTVDSEVVTCRIPSLYKHLLIKVSARVVDTSPAGTLYQFGIRINGDSGNNYSYQNMLAVSTTLTAALDSSESFMTIGRVSGDDASSGIWYSCVSFIPNYQSAFYKTSLSFSGYGADIAYYGASWANTSKIESIEFLAGSGIKTGSLVSVYGIR